MSAVKFEVSPVEVLALRLWLEETMQKERDGAPPTPHAGVGGGKKLGALIGRGWEFILLTPDRYSVARKVVVKCGHTSHGSGGLVTTTIVEVRAEPVEACPEHGVEELWGFVERKENVRGTQDGA